MKTIFDMGMRKSMGQWSYGWPNPYNTPVQTPSAIPAVPPPPEIPPEIARVVDAATRSNILGIIGKAKSLRNDVAAWWDANPNAREILGKRLTEYQTFLSESMAYDELAATLEWRLAQEGEAYIKDSEIASMEKYQKSSQELYDVVFGKAGDPGVASAPVKELALPGIVAVGSFLAAALI